MNILVPITNILLTLALAIFAFLQWKAVDKQNKLTLFSTRIEFYAKINDIVWKILFTFMDLKEGNKKTKDKNTSDICLLCLELSHNLLKTKQLFNQEIHDSLKTFMQTSGKYNTIMGESKNFAEVDIIEVFQKSDELKAVFENFFEQNSK